MEESARILPFLQRFPECYEGKGRWTKYRFFRHLLSINTWRPGVAEATLRVGGHLFNDTECVSDRREREDRGKVWNRAPDHAFGRPAETAPY